MNNVIVVNAVFSNSKLDSMKRFCNVITVKEINNFLLIGVGGGVAAALSSPPL